MVDESKLKGRIMEKGMTQKNIADEIGVSSCTLSRKITNKSVFNACEIEKICSILDIDDPLAYFFVGWLHKCNSA